MNTRSKPAAKIAPPHSPGAIRSGRSARRSVSAIAGMLLLSVGLTSSLQALDPSKTLSQYNCQNWSRASGLPADKINGVIQTPDGYLWMGSQNGLLRFDGNEFKVVPIDLPEARGQDVGQMNVTPDGKLWFSIINGAWGSYDGRSFSAIGDEPWRSDTANASAIHVARDGAIWGGSVYGWARWVNGQPAASQRDDHIGSSVLCIDEDASGRVWLGTAERGLFYWQNGKSHLFPDEELKTQNIFATVVDASGDIWVGGVRGLYHYDSNFRRKELLLPSTQVYTLLIDRHGALWIGTSLMGLGRYQNGQVTFLQKSEGLSSDWVTSLFEDSEGSLWASTVDGVSQLTDVKFPIYSAKEGLAPGSATSVAASQRGGLWIATAGGVSYFDGHTATNYIGEPILPNNYVRRIYEAKNGDAYLCDGNKNINVLRDGVLAARYPSDSWAESFAEDSAGLIVAIGPNLKRIRNGRIEPYVFEGAEPNFDWINGITLATDGSLWIATNNGLFRVKAGRVQHWTTAEGLSANRVHFINQDADGSFWIGFPTGLMRLKNDRFTAITKSNGLSDDRVYSMIADDHDNVWLACGRGLLRVTRQSLVAVADGTATHVDATAFDGLESIKFTDRTDQGFSACKTADGRLWFPNPRGVVMVDPTNYFTNRVPPRVYVNRINVDGIEVTAKSLTTLRANHRSIEFFFTSLSYVAPKKMRVRYRLQGFDPDWIEAGAHRSVLYNNLSAGDYTFAVQAANSDGVWSTVPAQQSFHLPPPFYRTIWFYLLACVAGTLVIAAVYRLNVRQLKLRQQKLEAANNLLETKVTERTIELAYERDLLRTLMDSSPDQIYFKDAESRFIKSSNAQATAFGAGSPEELVGKTDYDFFPAEHAEPALAEEQEIIRTGVPLIGKLEKIVAATGEVTWLLASKMPLRNKANEIIGTFGISKDVTVLKEAELKLIEAHKQLLETSRQAGMAEVATSVLHNVGNVLNSVNVSATLVSDQIRKSKLANVAKIADLLGANAADLATFLANDPRGQKIHPYLESLGSDLLLEQQSMISELGHLRKNIEHIKEVVSMQQSFAKVSGVAEAVSLVEVIDDALRMNSSSLTRHEVELVRDIQADPKGLIERHKVIQIIVNLVRNAKYACEESARPDKRIIVRVTQNGDRAVIAVIDNGVGIAQENLTRIFAHGFTTKKEGHGFGLHSGALSAKELGGTLSAMSDGPGQGATFVLELPLNSNAELDA